MREYQEFVGILKEIAAAQAAVFDAKTNLLQAESRLSLAMIDFRNWTSSHAREYDVNDLWGMFEKEYGAQR